RETCVAEWGQVCAEKAPKALEMFDTQLADTEYVAGDRFTIADITLGVAVAFAAQVKVVAMPDLPNLARWQEQINARESFAAG
ncbi:MAG: glutathione S-transferase, partial [Candidatus Azotimanducaceae bacterium]